MTLLLWDCPPPHPFPRFLTWEVFYIEPMIFMKVKILLLQVYLSRFLLLYEKRLLLEYYSSGLFLLLSLSLSLSLSEWSVLLFSWTLVWRICYLRQLMVSSNYMYLFKNVFTLGALFLIIYFKDGSNLFFLLSFLPSFQYEFGLLMIIKITVHFQARLDLLQKMEIDREKGVSLYFF